MNNPSIYNLMGQDKLESQSRSSNVIKEPKIVDNEINKLLFENLMSGIKL